MPAAWLTVGDVADAFGIGRRCATKLLSRCAAGGSWRGYALEVRRVHGRGGKSGLAYEVSLSSLSEALGEPEKVEAELTPQPRDVARDQGDVVNVRFRAIEPILRHDPNTAARATALEAQAAATGTSVRTLHRWIEAYETWGFNGLARRRPSNAGERRVFVSRKFDGAYRSAGYQDELLATIAKETTQGIKGVWKSRREASGWAAVRRDAETVLDMICERYGVALPAEAMKLSRRRVEEFVHYRVVNILKNDRKRYDDTKPRIRRDWTGMAPMDIVVADVKPLDVIVTRPDGSTAWPRVIGFQDAATCRLFLYVVLCNPGEGVRQEHVNQAFLEMIALPDWGFPRKLYIDNGSEFAQFEKLRDAMGILAAPGARTLIKARPYNASAKTIEPTFARFDLTGTCILPGYAGKDRMTKKTQTVGRPPQAYPHSLAQFGNDIQDLVADLNHKPMEGRWSGRSPEQIFQEHVAQGWRPITVEPLLIDAALCDFDQRQVDRGYLRIKGKRYPVTDVPHHTTVSIALPWRRGADPLYQRPGSQAWIGLAEDMVLPADWIEGAEESGRRQKDYLREVRKLDKDAPDIDPMETVRHRQRKRVQAELPHQGPAFDLGSDLLALSDGMALVGEGKAAVITEAERIKRARDAATLRLNRTAGHG